MTTSSRTIRTRVPQLTLEEERALLALHDFAVACRTFHFEDYDVAELLRDAAAVLARLGVAAGAGSREAKLTKRPRRRRG